MPKGIYKRTEIYKQILSLAKLKYYNFDKILIKKFLIKEYIKNKKSTYYIAKQIGCSSLTIINYLKKYGIEIRATSEYRIGTCFTEETKQKMRESHKGIILTEEKRLNISKSLIGRKLSEEHIKNISLSHGGTGIPYENNKYPKIFYQLKEKIKKRDNYTCQNKNCGVKQKDYYRALDVHHIDYDKQNCEEINLITLCNRCNIQVNFNRDYWFSYFTYVMEEKLCLSNV